MKRLTALLMTVSLMALMACGDLPMADELERLDEPETVTNTFELTLNGEVPPDQLFTVLYTPVHNGGAVGGTEQVVFCGQPDPRAGGVVVSDEDCVGGGNTYTYSGKVTVAASLGGIPEGTVLQAQWFRIGPDTGAREAIHEIEEPLETGMTYTAEYTFGTGADDDKVEPTAAPIEPTPAPTKEVPDGMGKSGAGGLATGASVPWGPIGLAASGLLAAGYAVLRGR